MRLFQGATMFFPIYSLHLRCHLDDTITHFYPTTQKLHKNKVVLLFLNEGMLTKQNNKHKKYHFHSEG